MSQRAEWIAVDWGTSNLRAWMMNGANGVIETVASDRGMGTLEPSEFEPTLLSLLGPFLSGRNAVPVIACGMIGARQGWAEAPYVAAPCAVPDTANAVRAPVKDSRLDVHILPGVKQATPPDVMRGEETQIAGFLAANPGFEGVVCLPGTHTKWVHVSAGEIVSFATFMTGELFALLSQKSVLRFSVQTDEWNGEAFREAVEDAMSMPQKIGRRLFSLRAGALLDGTGPATCRASLSGWLLGLEIAGAREYWLGREIVLVGAKKLTALYSEALKPQGAILRQMNGDEMVLAGLKAAYEGKLS